MRRWFKTCITFVSLLAFFMSLSFSQNSGDIREYLKGISKDEIRGIIEFLGDDLLEGRAPGTRGGMLAEKYVRSIYQLLGIKPFFKDYYQPFILKGFTVKDLEINANGINLKFRDDVVGTYVREVKNFDLEGDAVFVGFGIYSKDWNWDDFKNFDLRDKILIVRVNDPGFYLGKIFNGRELTYFGRWVYKLEEAARRGAKAALLIHTNESAGYGWNVVKNSWGGESLYLKRALENNLKFRGWIREESLKRILTEKGISLEELYRKSLKRNFKPVELGFKIKISGKNSFREIKVNNVVGLIRGSNPSYRDKYIVISAHIDHLGMNPSLRGDNIFNGAIDNGSAVASMIVTAKILKMYQRYLNYSVIVLACEAEEEGLLGSDYFANSIDPKRVIANINFESTPVWERAKDFMGIGAKYSTLERILKRVLEREGLKYSYFSMSNQGFFFRSDQFSFAKRGIPSVWITAGEDYISGRNRLKEFFTGNYHTVNDEFNPEWKLDSTVQTIRVALLLIDYINNYHPKIVWKGKMSFPVY